MKDFTLKHSYKYTNLFVHSSAYEIIHSLIVEDDGSISPAESNNNEVERDLAGNVLIFSIDILIRIMDTTNEHYSFGHNDILQEFVSEFVSAVRKQKK